MKRLVIVGTGERCSYSFAKKLYRDFPGKVEIVGICDKNIKRCEYYEANICPGVKIYTDFDVMMDALRPDAVLVTTPDGFHHEYIIKALERGCDVYSEKPITIDEEKCLAIREAEKASGKHVTVTFNCRFMPYFAKLKELMASGIIGKPLAINYEYVLNTNHGGDYFKRWHRFMNMSGGMMVHKATHHFDIINWLLGDEPVSVSAQGARLYFGNDDRPHAKRCSECQYRDTCESYLDVINNDVYKKMYVNAEDIDGYIRDHCSFEKDTDIYDSMSVSVAYKKGALLTYSLNLFNTEEGFNLHIIGEKGVIETSSFTTKNGMHRITVKMRDGSVNEISFPTAGGTHAGGDDRMINMLFGLDITDDPLNQCAGSFDGFKSCMIGIAANRSIKEGVRIELTPILDKLR